MTNQYEFLFQIWLVYLMNILDGIQLKRYIILIKKVMALNLATTLFLKIIFIR